MKSDPIEAARREDSSFRVDVSGLEKALHALTVPHENWVTAAKAPLPKSLPEQGLGESAVLEHLAPHVLGGALQVDGQFTFANMDPPTPWVTWAATLWNARLNQNLLHPATGPAARAIEKLAVDWLSPFFGMTGGHMVPDSTLANLTALWAARDLKHITAVAAPDTAHISVEKAARILGLRYRPLPTERCGRLRRDFQIEPEKTCLVLVAGSTVSGTIDPLDLAGRAAWTHIDAAWAGPLRLSNRHNTLLDGIEAADSISISAHKWFFQPKESALILFRNSAEAETVLSFASTYLAAPNIGLLGSHGAIAVPLLALLWAWGREGMAERLDRCMDFARRFTEFIEADARLELFEPPETGVVVWRPVGREMETFRNALPSDLVSQTTIAGEAWFRCVAANPVLNIEAAIQSIQHALDE